MARFITSTDVQRLISSGVKEYVLDSGDILTDLSKEALRVAGIRVRYQTESSGESWTSLNKIETVPAAGKQEMTYSGYSTVAEQADDRVYDLVIEKGTLILPEIGEIAANIGIRHGCISTLGIEKMKGRQNIDAAGKIVIPGIVDPHTHMGLFTSLEEDLHTETRSALLGGVTTIGCFFNQTESYKPFLESLPGIVAKNSAVDLMPHLTLRNQEQFRELDTYIASGVRSFKTYMCGIPGLFPAQEDGFIVQILNEFKKMEKPPLMCIHAENTSIVDYAVSDAERASAQTLEEWEKTHPELAEGEAVNRACYLSRELDVPIYIVHVSSKSGVEALKTSKPPKLYAETTSPYLTIDQDSKLGVNAKMLPPIRDRASCDALWEAIEQGCLSTIGTDNTSLTLHEKQAVRGMGQAVPGYPALGVHLVSVLNEAICRNVPLTKVIPLMTMNPAKLFGIYPKKGSLLPGSDADIVIVDPNSSKVVTPGVIKSRSDFALHEGETLRAWPYMTIKAGEIVAVNGQFTGQLPAGTVLKR